MRCGPRGHDPIASMPRGSRKNSVTCFRQTATAAKAKATGSLRPKRPSRQRLLLLLPLLLPPEEASLAAWEERQQERRPSTLAPLQPRLLLLLLLLLLW